MAPSAIAKIAIAMKEIVIRVRMSLLLFDSVGTHFSINLLADSIVAGSSEPDVQQASHKRPAFPQSYFGSLVAPKI
jgi:hypothetical protein